MTIGGGASIGKKLFVGSGLQAASVNAINSTATTSSTTGTIITAGGIASSNTTDATDSGNGGSLTLAGGAAIGKTLIVAGTIENFGQILAMNNLDATSSSSGGAMTITGGLGIGKKCFVGDVLTGSSATASTSNTIGGIVTPGGYASSNTTDATSSTNGGGMTLAGGAAIAKTCYVGGALNVTGLGHFPGLIQYEALMLVMASTTGPTITSGTNGTIVKNWTSAGTGQSTTNIPSSQTNIVYNAGNTGVFDITKAGLYLVDWGLNTSTTQVSSLASWVEASNAVGTLRYGAGGGALNQAAAFTEQRGTTLVPVAANGHLIVVCSQTSGGNIVLGARNPDVLCYVTILCLASSS